MDSIPPSPPPDKKGLLPLVIAGIICGGGVIVLVVFGAVIFMMGKFAVSRLATRPTPTGYDQQEEPASVALVADDVSVTPETTQPEPKANGPPSWVPVYPNVLRSASRLRQEESGVVQGTTTFETGDSVDKVKAFYEARLKTGGFEMTVDRTTTRLLEKAEITARKEGGKQTFHATVHQVKEQTTVTLNYEDAEQADVQ